LTNNAFGTVVQGYQLISKIRIPARPYQLKQVRCIVKNALRSTALTAEEVDRGVLAVNEACMNIIQHGYKQNEAGEIILEIYRNADEMLFRLTDFAPPVDECTIKGRDWADIRPGGLGVNFMYEGMDVIKYRHLPEGTGNILEMTKKLPK
jgi:sigma-B regulation protein RsbU (phosphoserine phosphatase)